MIKNALFSLIVISIATLSISMQTKSVSHNIFNTKGELTDYQNMFDSLRHADIILFGEYHNNPIAHWLQYELTKSLFKTDSNNLILGAEMFEADDQLIINEYLSGLMKESYFKKEAKLWPNYATDYRPLLEFAKDNNLEFIATNIPRRYANLVSKKGFEGLDSISDLAKKYFAPLPMPYDPELPCYKNMLNMMGGMEHANTNLPKAQASKDATMAHFINENMKENSIFLHFNGTYHSDNYESIVWYLKKYNPELKVMTISTREYDDIANIAEEDIGVADFIIAVDADMTKTY
jgi:uncharacterized iron-regulated protein